MNRKKTIIFFITLIILLSLILSSKLGILYNLPFLAKLTGHAGKEVTGKITSAVFDLTICLNNPPTINGTSCPTFTFENQTIQCQFYTNDTDTLQTLTYSSVFNGTPTVFTVNSSGGVYDVPDQFDLGNHTYNVTVSDNSGCVNQEDTKTFYIYINSSGNHPPYLLLAIPNVEWEQDTILVPWDLDNHFDDVDGDILSYSSDINPNINIQIDAFGVVTLTPAPGYYGDEYVYFYAQDPYNATAQSNLVRLRVLQKQKDEKTDDTDSFPRGGYSGLAATITCFPDWQCDEWGECFPQGFRVRECPDINNCSSSLFKPNLTETCDYTPTCTDGLKNGDELGVDCGGLCKKECEMPLTCYDGILNADETGIDCGGSCQPCLIIESCYDGILNGDETGIDCGGSCQQKCAAQETPAKMRFIDWTKLWIILLILAIIYQGTYYTYIHRKDISKFAKKVRKGLKRTISMPVKKELQLLQLLDRLEANLYKKTPDKSIMMLSRIMTAYLATLLKTQVEMTHEEIVKKLHESSISHTLKGILKSFFTDLTELEFSSKKLSKTTVLALIYESKNIVINTLNLKKTVAYAAKTDIKAETAQDEVFLKAADISIHLINHQFTGVKSSYQDIRHKIRSENIKNKFINNMLKRFKLLYHLKNEKRS